MESFLKPFRSNAVQPAKLEQSYSDYFDPSTHCNFFKKRDEQSELLFTRMLEAENDPSSTFSSQPSLVGQAVTLDIQVDEPCIYAVSCCGTASTIIMEEHPNVARIRSRKEAGADPVALVTKHYDEEIAENESFTSDEEDYHPVGP